MSLNREKIKELIKNKLIIDKGFEKQNLVINSIMFVSVEESDEFIDNINKSTNKVEYFNLNIFENLYKYYSKNNNLNKFYKDFETYFNDVLSSDYHKYINNFKIKEFYNLKKYIEENNFYNANYEKAIFKFNWDVTGYSFGPLQYNIKHNEKIATNLLKECGFTNEELNKLKNPPLTHKNNKNIINKYPEQLGLNDKLLKNKKIIYEHCKKHLKIRYDSIKNRDYIKSFKYDKINTFIQLLDHDIQFYFSNNTSSKNNLASYLVNLKNNGVKILTGEDYLKYKLSLKYAGDKTGYYDIKRRYENINNIKISDKKNIDISYIDNIITPEIILNSITKNEVSTNTLSFSIDLIISKFNEIISEIKLNEIIDINVNNENVIEYDETTTEKLSEITESILTNNYNPVSMYNLDEEIEKVKKANLIFINSEEEVFLKDIVKNVSDEFNLALKNSNNITTNFEEFYVVLKKLCNKIYSVSTSNKSFSYLRIIYKNFEAIFENFIKNDFLTSYREIKNIANSTFENIKLNINKNIFADIFLYDYAKDYYNHVEKNNPFKYMIEKSGFLKLKELDYRNMEASLRQMPSFLNDIDRDKMYVYIYIILCFVVKKNKYYKTDIEENTESSIDKISKLLKKIKNSKWKHNYSEIEKQISLMYNFVKVKDNPFKNIMNDKGFNESQNYIQEVRKEISKSKDELLDKIHEVFYGDEEQKGLYDVFQSVADIAFELSRPINLYTDLSLGTYGYNPVDSILNACVSSIEMQTSMLIYDFIFNFKIPIGEKRYSLNDLNNIIKIINAILSSSNSNSYSTTLQTRLSLSKSTSEYSFFKKIGFLTYIKEVKKYNNNIDDEMYGVITGYYAEDEEKLMDALEYCRRKVIECDMGDYKELKNRFYNLNHIEWVSIYANYRLNNVDSIKSNTVLNFIKPILYLNKIDIGYLNIKNIKEQLEQDILNLESSKSMIDGYMSELLFEINNDSTEFDEFKKEVSECFYKFYTNILINEKNIIDKISNKISDEKIYDWLMKIAPTYDMLIKLFDLKHIGLINTLDYFINSLVDKFNVMLKMTFDQFKKDVIAKTETRKFQMLDKENYYFIQSFPLMIDWLVLNLDTFINQLDDDYSSSFDKNNYGENFNKLDSVFNEYLIKLKQILMLLSEKQINEFKNTIMYKLNYTNIDEERVKEIVESIVDYTKIENININLTEDEINEITNIIEEELENRFKVYY